MNRYLTDRSLRQKPWQVPVLLFLLLFIIPMAWVSFDFLLEGDLGTAGVGFFLLALLLWPFCSILLDRYRRSKARSLAEGFSNILQESVPIDEAFTKTGVHGSEKLLKSLISRRYLQNLFVDWSARRIHFTAVSDAVVTGRVTIVYCPNCGGQNQFIAGRINKCAYCGSALIGVGKNGGN